MSSNLKVNTILPSTGTAIGIGTASGNVDVLGHTNLNNVSVAGVTTFAGNIDANGDLDVDGHTNLDNVNISGISSTGNIYITTGGNGRKLSFAGDGSSHYIKMDDTLNGPIINGYGGIAFETNGTNERLRINSNGSIQITPEGSTSNPYMLIDTSGDSVRFSAQKTSGNNEFRFLTQSSGTVAERLRIKSDGDVSINDGNLIVASGHGIDFSATGNLSGTQSELLDDYEEGTWTPEINGGYSSISYHNPRIGYYTKVGNHVSFQIYLYVYQATGAAANVQITLPFTSLSNSGRETGAYTAYSNGFMSSSWNEKSGCGYLIGGNYSYLRPCKLTNGAVIYGNDTRLGTGANNQYLIICGQMFAA